MENIFAEPAASFAGTWLRRRRTEALLTHQRLATITGLDANIIRDIETGDLPRPPADIIRLLLDALETAGHQTSRNRRAAAPAARAAADHRASTPSPAHGPIGSPSTVD